MNFRCLLCVKCCVALSCQVFLNQTEEVSTWLYVKVNAVCLVAVNWGRGGVEEGQAFGI